MKRFKKKHTKIPSKKAILRLVRLQGKKEDGSNEWGDFYQNALDNCPSAIPEPIRLVTLATMDPHKRKNIRYWPDLRSFFLYEDANRSLPVDKFFALFNNFLPKAELDAAITALSKFRLEFYTQPEQWVSVYADGHVKSCMTGSDLARCYVHPQNKLALATLYPPGGSEVIARSIVNVDEKWYVRLFGDTTLLAELLQEQGYTKLNRAPYAFRMYAFSGFGPRPHDEIQYPYFDFSVPRVQILSETHNPATGFVEVIINPDNHP